jgi:thioredoxin reductase (NADPH)
MISVCILGAGPAGMSCALWCRRLGMEPQLYDIASEVGGTLVGNKRPNNWILGNSQLTSHDIAKTYRNNIDAEKISVETAIKLNFIKIEPSEGISIYYSNSDGDEHIRNYSALVIASGIRARGQEMFSFLKNRYFKGTINADPLCHFKEMQDLKNKKVLVVGGGDNAFFTANDLAGAGVKVKLLSRSTPIAQKSIQIKVKNHELHGRLERVTGNLNTIDENKDGFIVTVNSESQREMREIMRIELRIGFTPRLELLETVSCDQVIQRDDEGYPVLDGWGRSTIHGVYFAGDIVRMGPPAVVTALASGASSAKAIADDFRESNLWSV